MRALSTKGLYKKVLTVFCLLLMGITTAQIYPVQVTPQIVPPYSFKLSDYTTTTQEKLFVNLLLTDAQESGRQVRLKIFVEGPGINFQSTDFVNGALPIVLDGGINQRLTNLDLQPYFNLNNLVGISPKQYSEQLPEGQYRFCFEVYDQFSGQRISNRSCANIYLVLNDPPLLNVPFRGDLVTAQNPQNIIFNWTPRHINAGAVQYEFTLKELWDTGMDPQAAFLASPPLYQTTTYANTLHYGPAQMQLLEGKTYGWQVRAFVSDGITTTSLFRNNGLSEIYHFTYRADCPPPGFVLSEAQNSQTVKINWQMGEHLRYRVQYRKKGYGEDDWFGLWSQTNEATIRNLEAGTVYEFRVGGDCGPLQTSTEIAGAGLAYSPIHEFTMPTEDEMAYYNCGIPPEIEIANQNPLQQLEPYEVFTAGDFPIVVREVSGSNGYFTGWGYITLPFLEKFKEVIDVANVVSEGDINIGKFSRIRVEFDNIKINTDYQMTEGMVETSYDPNWSNVESVDEFIEDIGQLVGSIKEIISQIFDRRDEELNQLQELQHQLAEGYITEEEFNEQAEEKANNIEKLDDLLGEQLKEKISESPVVTEAQKEEVQNLGPTALASNDDLSQTDINSIKTKDAAARKRLEDIAEEVALAEDMYFVNEAYTLLSEDGVYQEVLEKIKTISEYLKESTELCKEQGWASYKAQGVFPYCLWKEAPIAEAFYYSKVDIPFVAGLTDGLYGEVEGLVLLPKMFYDLSTGMQEFIYAYTWAKLQCTPNKVALNQKRMGLLLEKLEREQAETSIWIWGKEQWYAGQKELTEYEGKRCEDAEKLRNEVDEFVDFIQERENLKQLIADVEEKLASYWVTVNDTDNEARYHHGKILVFAATFVVPGLGQLTKIKKVKKILEWIKKATPDDLLKLKNKYVNLIVYKIDDIKPLLRTEKNTAFFWSGKTNGIGGETKALEIAKSRGGTTLEGLLADKGVKMPNFSENPKIWEEVSAEYSNQVSGTIRAVIGKELREGNVWENIELPRLKANNNVTEIIKIDPVTLEEKVIFKRQ